MLTIVLIQFLVIGVLATLLLVQSRVWVRLRNPVGEDERYLLMVARAARGRLILLEEAREGRTLLRCREVPGHAGLEPRGQVDRLLRRGLIAVDASGLEGRYALTAAGWTYVKRLPPFQVEVRRPGNWFNSVATGPKRRPK
jgi:hypothetical protein